MLVLTVSGIEEGQAKYGEKQFKKILDAYRSILGAQFGTVADLKEAVAEYKKYVTTKTRYGGWSNATVELV